MKSRRKFTAEFKAKVAIYLNAYETGPELYKGLKHYFQHYNQQRRHSSLAYQIPAEVFHAA
jgi:transposase InsO family protein